MNEHIRKLHDRRRDVNKSDKSTRHLSKYKVQTQRSKIVDCTMCLEMFTCQQNIDIEYRLNAIFKCNMWPNLKKKGNQ